jgi:hypothetical protein
MSYATPADLAAYMNVDIGSLPGDSQRMLDRASELVDYVTLERVNQDSPDELSAARCAACAQTEFWIANGESDLYPALKSKTIGKVTMAYAGTDRGAAGYDDLCPRAVRYLWREGLLQRKVDLR